MTISDIPKGFIDKILSSGNVIKKEENDSTLAFLVYRKPFGRSENCYQIYFCNKQASDAVCLEMEAGKADRFAAVCVFLSIKKSLFAK